MSDQNLKIRRAIHYFSPPCIYCLKLTVVQMTSLRRKVTVTVSCRKCGRRLALPNSSYSYSAWRDWGQPL